MRRKRPRVVWLPNDRLFRFNVPGTSTNAADSSLFEFALDVPNDGTIVTAVIGVVSDQPASLAFAGGLTSLADLESSAYRLRRLVGKIFVASDQDSPAQGNGDTWTDALITCGFIVLKTNQAGDPLSSAQNYGANLLASVGDPWIWRRTWLLGNNAERLRLGAKTAFQPETNTTAGSALDGPHLDQKTARVIGPEERLFFVASGQGKAPPGAILTFGNPVRIFGDVRVLASMRSSSGNRRNASR